MTLPLLSIVMTVTVPAVPAVTGEGKPDTASRVATAGCTVRLTPAVLLAALGSGWSAWVTVAVSVMVFAVVPVFTVTVSTSMAVPPWARPPTVQRPVVLS